VRAKTFTNGADAALVIGLYEQCVRDGFDAIPSLQYPWASWEDADVAAFGALLAEVPARHATLLKMTQCRMTHLDPLDAVIRAGALPNLKSIVLSGCHQLIRLPASLEMLIHLEALTLIESTALKALPALPANLRTMNLEGAVRLLQSQISELIKLEQRGVVLTGVGARRLGVGQPSLDHVVHGDAHSAPAAAAAAPPPSAHAWSAEWTAHAWSAELNVQQSAEIV